MLEGKIFFPLLTESIRKDIIFSFSSSGIEKFQQELILWVNDLIPQRWLIKETEFIDSLFNEKHWNEANYPLGYYF